MSDDGSNGPARAAAPRRQMTLAGETQRRARRATVGEVEDGLRNLMRVVKTHMAVQEQAITDARRAFRITAGAVIVGVVVCIVLVAL